MGTHLKHLQDLQQMFSLRQKKNFNYASEPENYKRNNQAFTDRDYSRVLNQSKQVLRFILLLVADAKCHDDQSVQVLKCRLICAFFVCIISFRHI